MSKSVNIFLLFVFCNFILGCASSGKKIEQNKVSQIKEGVTTEQEIISLFGPPYIKTLNSDGKIIMSYQYTKIKNRASNFIPVVNILNGGMDMHQQLLIVLINKEGKVEKYTINDANSEINSGLLNAK